MRINGIKFVNIFKRSVLIAITILFSSHALAINLTAQVDRNKLSSNETLRLIIAVDETTNNNIDFTQLEIQFDIINQQRSQRQQIINGKVSSLTQWILILAPKETGNLLIPSFRYKQVFSNPIQVVVNDSSAQDGTSNAEVILDITADKTSAYVQEQILLKTRLYYNIALSSYDAPEFALKDTTISLVSEATYKTTRNNERYQVLELIHALHPQSSGELIIPQVRWRLEKPSRGFFDRSGNPYLFVQSQPLSLDIKPIPAASTAQNWLPSTAVTITPKLQQTIKDASVGEPLNFSLTISANGLSASQLPEINLPSADNLQIFKERSSANDLKSGTGIIGARTSEFTIIPKESGELELPTMTLKWWNVVFNKEQQVTLNKQTLFVADSNLQQDSLPTIPLTDELAETNEESAVHSSFWQAIVWLGLLLIICGALLVYRMTSNRRAQTSPFGEPVSQRKIEAGIEESIEKGDLENVRALLILWGQNHFNDKTLLTSLQLANKIPSIQDDLTTLDSIIYGGQNNSPWRGEQVLSLIKSKEKKTKSEAKQELLRPLYR